MSNDDTKKEIESIDAILAKLSDPADVAHLQKVLYGAVPEDATDDIPTPVQDLAAQCDFEIKSYRYAAVPRQFTAPQLVKIGMIQHQIPATIQVATTGGIDGVDGNDTTHVTSTTSAPFPAQWHAIVHDTLEPMVDAAGQAGVNVLCLQEACAMPFAFCTREKHWCEFAEDAVQGRTVTWACQKAAQYDMVIVLPILERDAVMDIVWNTAVVIGHKGNVIGKSRKYHIPRVGDFNEATYYMEGNTGWPVFATKYGKIGIPICYSRHFPNTYLAHALNGAQILFNPSATVAGLSEPMWWTEQAANAVATSCFVGQLNRVGTETMPHAFTSGDGKPAHDAFGHFYGTTMLCLPDGRRTPPLSRTRNGLLMTQVDLNLQQVTRDNWCFNMCGRLAEYGAHFTDAATNPQFQPQIIKDPEH